MGLRPGPVGHCARERPDNAIVGDSVSDGLRAPPRTHSHNRCSEPLSVLAPHEGDGNNDGSGSRNRRCLGDLQPAVLRFPAQKVWGPPRKTGIGDSAIKGAWRLPEEGLVNNGKADAYRYAACSVSGSVISLSLLASGVGRWCYFRHPQYHPRPDRHYIHER
jgi:hypothetical protein